MSRAAAAMGFSNRATRSARAVRVSQFGFWKSTFSRSMPFTCGSKALGTAMSGSTGIGSHGPVCARAGRANALVAASASRVAVRRSPGERIVGMGRVYRVRTVRPVKRMTARTGCWLRDVNVDGHVTRSSVSIWVSDTRASPERVNCPVPMTVVLLSVLPACSALIPSGQALLPRRLWHMVTSPRSRLSLLRASWRGGCNLPLIATVALTLAAVPAGAQVRRALIVGVNDYEAFIPASAARTAVASAARRTPALTST